MLDHELRHLLARTRAEAVHRRRLEEATRAGRGLRRARIIAATIAGLFVLALPTVAGANDVTAAAVSCQAWTVTWAHFPEANVDLSVVVSFPDGTTTTEKAQTLLQAEGTASGPVSWTGTGPVDLEVSWDLDGPHSWTGTFDLDCPPPVPTTTTVPPVPTTVPEPQTSSTTVVAAQAAQEPVSLPGGPGLAYTASNSSEKALLASTLVAVGVAALWASSRPRKGPRA